VAFHAGSKQTHIQSAMTTPQGSHSTTSAMFGCILPTLDETAEPTERDRGPRLTPEAESPDSNWPFLMRTLRVVDERMRWLHLSNGKGYLDDLRI
jgi:hypothetical protein